MGNPDIYEEVRDAQRRERQAVAGRDEVKKKCQELRDIMARFGIKEKANGSYEMDYAKLVETLGPQQAAELGAVIEGKKWAPPPSPEPALEGAPSENPN